MATRLKTPKEPELGGRWRPFARAIAPHPFWTFSRRPRTCETSSSVAKSARRADGSRFPSSADEKRTLEIPLPLSSGKKERQQKTGTAVRRRNAQVMTAMGKVRRFLSGALFQHIDLWRRTPASRSPAFDIQMFCPQKQEDPPTPCFFFSFLERPRSIFSSSSIVRSVSNWWNASVEKTKGRNKAYPIRRKEIRGWPYSRKTPEAQRIGA